VVSELVTNGNEHCCGTVQLAVEHSVDEIHGSVTDDGDEFDHRPPDLSSQALRGRGLTIVDALLTRWGIRHGSIEVCCDVTLIGDRAPGEPNPRAVALSDVLAEEAHPSGDDRPAHHAHRPRRSARPSSPLRWTGRGRCGRSS
jgi:hypothetical protein